MPKWLSVGLPLQTIFDEAPLYQMGLFVILLKGLYQHLHRVDNEQHLDDSGDTPLLIDHDTLLHLSLIHI